MYKDLPTDEKSNEIEAIDNLPKIIAKLLKIRNYNNKDEISKFLNPINEDFHDPFLMKDMDKAVERVIEALVNKEKILIWGDYDVDGITATSLLYLFLQYLGGVVTYLIPDRESDGYGLSINGINSAKKDNVGLIITVDCGITSIEPTKYASENNIDIVISDHHEPAEELPVAYAIIDPKRNNCQYPFKHLAGVGVAFKLLQGILLKSEMDVSEANEYLDLVAIGTAADIVPMIGENRKIVVNGLINLNQSSNIGINALLQKLNLKDKKLKVSNIVFGMAPRINAVGRMGDAKRAVKLLTTNNPKIADELVHVLEIENNRRKEYDTHTLNEAISINETKNNYNPDLDNAIVIANEEWHVGVIGIVASRLVERYHRPSVVISIDDGVGKGSCRSISGINIYEILKNCSDLLKQFGGHEYAAGLEIEQKNIAEFRKRFNKAVTENIPKEGFNPKLIIDTKIDFRDINSNLMEYLYQFEPFGPENKQPIFVTENVEVVGPIRIVGANHIRVNVKQGDFVFDAIGFNLADKVELVENNRFAVNIAYLIEENTWNDRTYIQLKLKDIKG